MTASGTITRPRKAPKVPGEWRALALARSRVETTYYEGEEALARVPLDGRRLTPTEIVDYLRSLPTLWADSGTAGRQAIVSAIFAQIDVLGFERME